MAAMQMHAACAGGRRGRKALATTLLWLTMSAAIPMAIAAVPAAPAAAAAAAATPAPGDAARRLRDPSQVLVIAHRGCLGDAPEVSVASIEACAGKGIDGIELDIRTSRDGVLVAIHDATLERTTNGQGRVADHTAAELRQLRLRRGNGGPRVVVTDEHLPTLEEMLRAAKRHGLIVHLDIKDAGYAEVAEVVQRTGMAGQATAWLTGRPGDAHQPDPALGEVLAFVPRIQGCAHGAPASCRGNSADDLMDFARYDVAGYFLWYRTTPEEYARFLAAPRPAGTRLTTETLWEIDNLPRSERLAEYRRLRDAGATLFLTDHPEDMVAALNHTGSTP